MRARTIPLFAILSGCSLIVPSPADYTPDLVDAGQGPEDAGRDAGRDAGVDGGRDAAIDAGPCAACSGSTPHCDTELQCVQCLDALHCDDRDPCTDDRCSLGVCTHAPVLGCVVGLALGQGHSCVRRRGIFVQCWGDNEFGQIGDGTNIDRPTPTTVELGAAPDATPVTGLSAGELHTCAVRESGTLECWGDNITGAIGDGTRTARAAPVRALVADAREVTAGTLHTCARVSSGGVYCWGDNSWGQIGDGTAAFDRPSPTAVLDIEDAVEIHARVFHTCARLSTGQVACWGNGTAGQLGSAMLESSNRPVLVAGVDDAIELCAGNHHSCVRRSTGRISCWGGNSDGQLGNETTEPSLTPVNVARLADAVQITCGESHVCALRGDGSVMCWGRNDGGELGTGTRTSSSAPVPVLGIEAATPNSAIEVRAGMRHTCARLVSGAVVCWGLNFHGQLGQGAPAPSSSSPIEVPGL